MSPDDRGFVVAALEGAFGEAADVSPDADQPLHVLLGALGLPEPWTSPARAVVRFGNWPRERPEFFIDVAVVNRAGEPPRSNSVQTVLGSQWRQFSFAFPWTEEGADPVVAVMLWLTRFREST